MSENASHKKGIDLDVLNVPEMSGEKTEAETHTHEGSRTEPLQSNTPIKTQTAAGTGHPPVSKNKSRIFVAIAAFLVVGLAAAAALFHQDLYQFLGRNESALAAPGPLGELILRMESASKQLAESTVDTEAMSRRISSKSKIEAMLQAIDLTKTHQSEMQSAVDAYLAYTDRHQETLSENGETMFIDIGNFYRHGAYLHYTGLLTSYLDTMKKYLTYYLRHFDAIKNKQQPQTESYESLHVRHKRMFGLYESARSLNREMTRKLLAQYPDASSLFPSQQEAFFF